MDITTFHLSGRPPIATLKGYPFILNGLEFYLQDSHYLFYGVELPQNATLPG